MKNLPINNYINEDDVMFTSDNNRNNSMNVRNEKKAKKENQCKEMLRSLILLGLHDNTSSSGNEVYDLNLMDNHLTSKNELMNLINTLISSRSQKSSFETDQQWKTPLIEDFLPNREEENYESSGDEWNNSELNYYNKEIYDLI